MPHLHILIKWYIPQAWISENWEALGGGRIVYVQAVRDLHRISWYFSKYLAKDASLSAPWGTSATLLKAGLIWGQLVDNKGITATQL